MKRTGLPTAFLCFLLCACACSFVHGGIITGRVCESESGKGVRRVTVRAYKEGRSVALEALTENDGTFSFAGMPSGCYAVCVGWDDNHRLENVESVEVTADGSSTVNLNASSYIEGSWKSDRNAGCLTNSYENASSARMHRVRSAGQRFTARSRNIVFASARLEAVSGSLTYVRFSIHEGGPGGKQTGASKAVAPGSSSFVAWGAREVPVQAGKEYYLHIESCNGGYFLIACGDNSYKCGEAVFDGSVSPEKDIAAVIAGADSVRPVMSPTGKTAKPSPGAGGGKVIGNAGGMERGATLFDRDGGLAGWTVTGPSGRYEFGGIEPGEYVMQLDGRIVPRVIVGDGETIVVDQARQPKFELEKEVWGPGRVSFAQSFVAMGTAVTGFSLWRSAGAGKMLVSLYEETPGGKRIAGPYETEKDMVWICAENLPSDEFRTVAGKRYALELRDAAGKPWNHGMPRAGDVYPDGIAYYDGVAHAESDLGLTIYEEKPGLRCIAAAREDLHFIAEGPGSGNCLVAGQTFVATASNVVKAFANCGGWGGGVKEFIFSIHEDGPGGARIGPGCRVKMVCDWGADVVWFGDAVKLARGRHYYFQYRREDGGPFFSYLSKNVCENGRAYRDGKMIGEQFDQLFNIYGEDEPGSLVYPYNIKAENITANSATITWQTGNPSDGLVHFGTTQHLVGKAGGEDKRETRHSIQLKGLEAGTVYLYRDSSHTHKESSIRTYSRVYRFMTLPGGKDLPKYDKISSVAEPERFENCVEIVNPGFEDGVKGWKRIARAGREKEPERFVPNAKPFGEASGGIDGYDPHSGFNFYGWSYFGPEDSTWIEPREDWKREVIWQRIAVEAGREYILRAWILTGDRGRGWGRDSRVRLVVDETDGGLLENIDTVDRANATQWFATQHLWKPVSLRFTARNNHVRIGAEILQWWSLEACHLYVDEFSVRMISGDYDE